MFEKSFEYLKAQALTAKHMLDRLDAIEALQETALDKSKVKIYLCPHFSCSVSNILVSICDFPCEYCLLSSPSKVVFRISTLYDADRDPVRHLQYLDPESGSRG